MANGEPCAGFYVGLALASGALLISVCLNIFLYSLRRKDGQNRDGVSLYHDYYPNVRFEDEERQNQENPIYGNLFVDGSGGSMPRPEYEENEPMPKKVPRQDETSDPEDISYASLDLKPVKKRRKKKNYPERQNQAHAVQTHPASVPQLRHMEMRADCDCALNSQTSSLIMSRSSIYLNSHQVALETEELQRERERERERETERKSNHEWELMNWQGEVDQSSGQNKPSHDQGS